MTSDSKPTEKSANTSSSKSPSSPGGSLAERMLDELKDWVAQGHCQLAPGNEILPAKK